MQGKSGELQIENCPLKITPPGPPERYVAAMGVRRTIWGAEEEQEKAKEMKIGTQIERFHAR